MQQQAGVASSGISRRRALASCTTRREEGGETVDYKHIIEEIWRDYVDAPIKATCNVDKTTAAPVAVTSAAKNEPVDRNVPPGSGGAGFREPESNVRRGRVPASESKEWKAKWNAK